MKIKELMNILQNYRYISFDLFDTLIFRTVQMPEDIFDLVEAYYTLYHKPIKDFRVIRVRAEFAARRKCGKKEITLDDIYDNIQLPKEEKCELKKIENKLEIENCVSNPVMVDVVKRFHLQGKKIIITSDMYLSKATIEAILNKMNIPYDKIYVSSEVGVTKQEGSMFPYILNKLGISSQEIIHIGDNEISDIISPERYGIKGLERLVEEHKFDRYMFNEKELNPKKEHLEVFIERKFQKSKNIESSFRVGYNVLGPLLFEFCAWLHKQKMERKLEKLVFVAREGYLIKKCYEIMYPEEKKEVAYSRINRNLLRLPMLNGERRIESLIDSLPYAPNYTWNELFDYLTINESNFILDLTKKGFEINYDEKIHRNDLENGVYNKELNTIIDFLRPYIEEQSSLLLKQLTLDGYIGERIGLVNNSINGTGQYFIENFLSMKDESFDIVGLQFIKSIKCEERLEGRVLAWLTDENYIKHREYAFERLALVFEHLLFEEIGTAHHIEEDNGNVCVICETLRSEKNNSNILGKIQSAALEFVNEYCDNINIPIGIECVDLLIALYETPFLHDARLICNLYNDDVDGDRRLSETNETFKYSYCVAKAVPRNITWIEGYFKVLEKKEIYFSILKFSYICRANRLNMRLWVRFLRFYFKSYRINKLIQHWKLKILCKMDNMRFRIMSLLSAEK